jgi:transaldolase
MKFFIDTANVKEIREVASLGVVDGVTTNPSLVSKEGRDFKQVITEICSIVEGRSARRP